MTLRAESTRAPLPKTEGDSVPANAPLALPDWVLVLVVIVVVLALYLPRLSELTIRGEESGWARIGIEMADSGDWAQTKIQGTLYVDRPPGGSWLMALAGQASGGRVDLFAVRLPSVLATLLTSLVLFAYGRSFLGQSGAFAAALMYPTMGQVLQLGRLGESDAVFTCFMSASLLVWHLGYSRNWPRFWLWTAGYALVGLASLAKGIVQAPVYFGAVTVAFLLYRRDWRTLFSPAHPAGWAVWVLVVAAWAVPFYQSAGAEAFHRVMTCQSQNRLDPSKLVPHLFEFPLDTLACTLPWSLLLLLPLHPRLRRLLEGGGQHLAFLVIALAVTYPSVWFQTAVRGRHYMSMYPCIAMIAALIWDRWCGPIGDAIAGRMRQRLTWLGAGVAAVLAIGIGLLGWTASELPHRLEEIRPTTATAMATLVIGLGVAACLLTTVNRTEGFGSLRAILSLAILLGTLHLGIVTDCFMRRSVDIAAPVARLRETLVELGDKRLVSLGPVHHRFAWYYPEHIPEHVWPESLEELSEEVEYFCFDHRPGDTPERRLNGRGLDTHFTDGTLPFEWQLVTRIVVESSQKPECARVIVGRIVRKPDPRTTRATDPLERR